MTDSIAREMMRIIQSTAEEHGFAWRFYKGKDNWHIEVRHVERGFLAGVGRGDSFEAAWSNLMANAEKRAQAKSRELARRLMIN